MNGEVTDWIRGLGKFPEGSQIIFNPDGSVGAVMNGGKIYQPPEGVTYPSGNSTPEPAKNQYGYTEPEWTGMDDFQKGLARLGKDPLGSMGSMIGKTVTDPLGTLGSGVATVAGWSAPWLAMAAILGIGAIILFVSLQALLKTEGN